MNEAVSRPKETSESVRISSRVKKRLQEYCRRNHLPLRDTLDQAVSNYVKKRDVQGGL